MFLKSNAFLALAVIGSLTAVSCGDLPPGSTVRVAAFNGFVNNETSGLSTNVALTVSGQSINDAGVQMLNTGSIEQSGTFTIGNMRSSRDFGTFDISIPSVKNINNFSVLGNTQGCPSERGQACNEVLRIGLTFTETSVVGATGARRDALTWNLIRSIVAGAESFNGVITSSRGNVQISNVSVDVQGRVRGELDFRGSHFSLSGSITNEAAAVMPKSAAASLLILTALHLESLQ